ncbi:DUF4138 domain-containing protein [Flavivirga rizhaonensis]|uniref:DUF4138 domain-containing protein n=1 Tax=Flavivirga rizhaonensis TaxID=2559571 RepID=A0A4S1DYL3_9FLAO|nr:DUF4138 domain-containing protein [Flavivirga rizhaonensis]TGV03336.1 DUF4138 domain-containing protein [Flavivirga rizhaonensis]
MKTYFTLILLTCSMSIVAQQPLDTIYANDQKNVALFFPNPIRQGITGASHFVFTYNREKEQYFGLLQAKPGTESNLLTVTNDGKVYSYILKYSNHLPELNYFINENECIGNERPTIKSVEEKKTIPDSYENRKPYIQRASAYLLKSSFKLIATKCKNGIKLQLQKMAYDTSEVYLVIEVKNKSGINFEIDYLNVYRTNGNKKRKASYQRLLQEVIYKHKMPDVIINGQSQRFIYVLPKFVLGDNEKLMLELKELKGSRKVILETML